MQFLVQQQPAYVYTGTRPFDAAKPNIVFIHGAANDHSVWTLQARYFAHHGFNALAVDLPGHGKTFADTKPTVEAFADWIIKDRSRLFVSAYTGSTRSRNNELQRILADRDIPIAHAFEPQMGPGSVAFLQAPGDAEHRDFVTNAWAHQPLADLLNRLNGYARR